MKKSVFSIIDCPICKINAWSPFQRKLLVCRRCGFKRAKDSYFRINPEKVYSNKYFVMEDYANYEKERPALEKNFAEKIIQIRKYKKGGRLLEIGCAYGYFLNLAKRYYSCTGIELNPAVAEIAHKNSQVKVISGNFPKKNFKNELFDIICFFDVIEHLKEPGKYLTKAYQLLSRRGVLVIETGNIEAILPKIQGSGWRLIKPPIHLNYFGKKTLQKLLERYGFTVREILDVSLYRSLAQILYKQFKIKSAVNIFEHLFKYTIPLNTHDIILLIAQKV